MASKGEAPQPSRRQARRPHFVEIQFRGGPECWWEFKYAGVTKRVSGVIYLHDALRQVFDYEDL